MIAAPRFVFLHLHKSAGTLVNECLLRFIPGARQLGYHLPRSLIPPEFAHLPVLGLVRNPWSYYVSWYTFQAARPAPNALFLMLSEGGQLGFDRTIRNMLALGTDNELLDRAIAVLPAAYGNHGLNLPRFALEGIRGTGKGFYAFLHRYLFGEAANLHVGRIEGLPATLTELLDGVAEPVSAALREFLNSAPARNESRHAPYREYFDARLRDLVAERDADVVQRYGYRFEAA